MRLHRQQQALSDTVEGWGFLTTQMTLTFGCSCVHRRDKVEIATVCLYANEKKLTVELLQTSTEIEEAIRSSSL